MLTIIPGLTLSYIDLFVDIVGIMGGLALMYAILLEEEHRQDSVFVVGSASLFVYGLVHHDYVLMFAMLGIFVIAGREAIQITRGSHHHTTDEVKKYEKE